VVQSLCRRSVRRSRCGKTAGQACTTTAAHREARKVVGHGDNQASHVVARYQRPPAWDAASRGGDSMVSVVEPNNVCKRTEVGRAVISHAAQSLARAPLQCVGILHDINAVLKSVATPQSSSEGGASYLRHGLSLPSTRDAHPRGRTCCAVATPEQSAIRATNIELGAPTVTTPASASP
jgi:hypothetical protein